MGEVVGLDIETTQPIPPEKVLAGALKEHEGRPFSRVMVLAVYDDNGEEYQASSDPDAGACLFDMERFRHRLMKLADEQK